MVYSEKATEWISKNKKTADKLIEAVNGYCKNMKKANPEMETVSFCSLKFAVLNRMNGKKNSFTIAGPNEKDIMEVMMTTVMNNHLNVVMD